MYIHANTCLYIRFCIHYFHVCWPHQNKHIKNFQSTKLQRTSFDHGDEMSCLYASRPPPGWRLGDFFSFWHFFQISTKSTLIRGTPLHLSVISRDKESAGFEKLGRNSLDPTHDAQIFFCGTHIFYNSQSSRRYSKAPLFCHARWATCIGRSLHDLCMSSRQLSYMLIFSISFQVPTGDLITCKPTHECIDWILTPHLGKEFSIACHLLPWSVNSNSIDLVHRPSVLHAFLYMVSYSYRHLKKKNPLSQAWALPSGGMSPWFLWLMRSLHPMRNHQGFHLFNRSTVVRCLFPVSVDSSVVVLISEGLSGID